MSQEERARILAYAKKSLNRMLDMSTIVFYIYGKYSVEWAFVNEMALYWSDVCDTIEAREVNTFRYYTVAKNAKFVGRRPIV